MEITIKNISLFFTLTLLLFTALKAEYTPFIESQLTLMHQMNDSNISQKELQVVMKKQELIYIKTLERVLLNKNLILDRPKPYQKELFTLHKLIKRNTSHGNKYAVLRDEVLVKSYQILQIQNKMSRYILRGLNHYKLEEFNSKMNDAFIKNQEEMQKITTKEYKSFLHLKEKSKILNQVQKNIKDYYALIDINADVIKYFAIYEKRMYRLNKYNNLHILPLALTLDNTKLGKIFNTYLSSYNLSYIKVLLILFISFIIYMIRTRLYRVITLLLSKISILKKYTHEIINDIYPTMNILFMTINIHLILHIYYDFYTAPFLNKFFNTFYALLFTIILYRILNTAAGIRIEDISQSDKKIKSEMVNVGIKIINFLILIMGILLVLHFAGANLTTVLSGLGIGGFAIAFAARESLANFLGTISILMSDTFSQGDWIIVDDKEGTVVEIGLRVTTIRTFSNALVAIPNGVIVSHPVTNWSKRTLGRRIKMSLGVKYDSKSKNIHLAVTQIRHMLQTHPNIATDKSNFENHRRKSTKLVSTEDILGVKRTLHVYLDEFSDSSINILVYCFTKKTDWSLWLETKEDIMYKIMTILEENNLEFAFPSLSLYNEKSE